MSSQQPYLGTSTTGPGADFAQQALTPSIGGSVGRDLGLGTEFGRFAVDAADLDLEPDSIRAWLTEFGQIIVDLRQKRDYLNDLAADTAGFVQLGDMDFSAAIKSRISRRLGAGEEGLALAADNVVREMERIHEAMRRALATHLNADLEAERIIAGAAAEPTE